MSHTPAINKSLSISTNVETGYIPLDSNWQPSGPYVPGPSKLIGQDHQSRPESVHSPLVGGWRYPKPWVHTRAFASNPRISYMTRQKAWPHTGTHYLRNRDAQQLAIFQSPVRPTSAEINLCLIYARNKLRENGAQLGVAFLERKKTASMMAGKLELITDSIASVVRRKPVGTVRRVLNSQGRMRRQRRESVKDYRRRWLNSLPDHSARRFANEWLEVQYGWAPTLMDMYGGLNALASFEVGKPKTVCAKHVMVHDRSNKVKREQFGTFFDQYVRTEILRSTFIRLDYESSSPSASFAADIGMINPLSIAWEIVPFSFVYDWVHPIGPWLESLDAAAGLTFKSGSVSTLARTTRRSTAPIWKPAFADFRLVQYEPGFAEGLDFRRSVYSSSPVPWPPKFSPKIGVGRFKNGMALLAQLLGRYK